MAIMGGGPIGSLPISGQTQTAATIDDDIVSSVTFNACESYDAEAEEAYYDGTQAAPLEDAPQTNADIVQTNFIDPTWVIDEEEWTPDWAQAPPDFEENVPNQALLGEVFDDDEPVTDGLTNTPPDFDEEAPKLGQTDLPDDDDEPIVEFTTQAAPTDQFDETGQTTGWRSNEDLVDEDEPVSDGQAQWPLADADAVTVDDLFPQELGQIYDEDEPVTDGSLQSPLEDVVVAADISSQEVGVPLDEDEPVTDGALGTPGDFEENVPFTASNEWVLEDEELAEGLTSSPLEDADGIVFRPALGQDFEEEEPVSDGWFSAPVDIESDRDLVARQFDVPEWDEDEPDKGWQASSTFDADDSTIVFVTGISINVSIGCYHVEGFAAIPDGSGSWAAIPSASNPWSGVPDGATSWSATPNGPGSWVTLPDGSTVWESEC